nr:unnamed protein product [Callosobruchus chinensis]
MQSREGQFDSSVARPSLATSSRFLTGVLVDSSSPLCWSQAQEKREGWKPHFCKTTHTQNPQRNTTHRHQPRNSDLFKFFRGRTPGLIAWAVAMNKPGALNLRRYDVPDPFKHIMLTSVLEKFQGNHLDRTFHLCIRPCKCKKNQKKSTTNLSVLTETDYKQYYKYILKH